MSAAAITRGSVLSRRGIERVAITRARHGPGHTLPLHAHPVSCVVLILAGGFLERVDGRAYSCRPGDVLLRPAGAAHANRYGDTGAAYAVLELPDRVLSALDCPDELLSRIRLFRSERAAVLLDELRTAGRGPASRIRPAVEELLAELLGSALPEAEAAEGAPVPDGNPPAWLERVRDRVSAEFRSRPSLEELAAEAGVHPDHVSRAFRRHFGFTISDLIRRRRVEHAAEAIRTTERSLAGIAYDAGFSDQSHMSRQLKRYLGITPARLRRL